MSLIHILQIVDFFDYKPQKYGNSIITLKKVFRALKRKH